MYNPKKISIIGFGRFGQTLYRMLKDDFEISIYNKSPLTVGEKSMLSSTVSLPKTLEDVYRWADVVFFCVPISSFENVIKENKKFFRSDHLLIDVLSVKMHPKKVFEKYLKNTKTQALLTHPMFGPDSSKKGFANLPLIIDKFKTNDGEYNFWKSYFSSKKINVIEMSSQEHDKLAANSQGITHFIGRLLEGFGIKEGPIDSLGTKKLLEIKEQTCNDTWQLFTDLQNYNPYTKSMRLKIGQVYDNIYNKLLPKRINKKYLIFGIQGGMGSFNEEAILKYLSTTGIKHYKIKYLYTTKNVLNSLHRGEIDFGQFAISNVKGGIVHESLMAIPQYKFKIAKEFDILITHSLMKRKDISLNEINLIMAHPQAFAQCKDSLLQNYSNLKTESGVGEYVDPAKIAKALFDGKLPKTTAILGPKTLAMHYNFDVIEEGLEDVPDNLTKFLIVKK